MSVTKVNKDILRIEIAELISKIKDHSDRIGGQKIIPQSDLDVVLHLIEELHRKTVVWSYLNELPEETSNVSTPASPAPASTHEFKVPSPVLNAIPQHDVVAETETSMSEKEMPLVSDALPKVVDIEAKIIEPIRPAVIPETHLPPFPSQPETADEEIAFQNLKDIRSFIGFNEKLMYIRQVFRGNNVAYDEALNRLNSMKTYSEAAAYLAHLSEEFKWGKDFEPVEIFQKTVKRRFL